MMEFTDFVFAFMVIGVASAMIISQSGMLNTMSRLDIIEDCRDQFYDIEHEHKFLWKAERECVQHVCEEINLSSSFGYTSFSGSWYYSTVDCFTETGSEIVIDYSRSTIEQCRVVAEHKFNLRYCMIQQGVGY